MYYAKMSLSIFRLIPTTMPFLGFALFELIIDIGVIEPSDHGLIDFFAFFENRLVIAGSHDPKIAA